MTEKSKKQEKQTDGNVQKTYQILTGILTSFGAYYIALETGVVLANFFDLTLIIRTAQVVVESVGAILIIYAYLDARKEFKQGLIVGLIMNLIATMILTGLILI